MADAISPAQPSGWRIPKACQECRKRKIKCNGVNPCKTCQLRHTPCIYREVIRQRKKKHQYTDAPANDEYPSNGATRAEYGARQQSPGVMQPARRRNASVSLTFNNSVSATHMASPSCKVQLYYGSTSHFALMHEIYRGLISGNQSAETEEPQGEVEEAGAGLDMFSFRRIFFGTQAESHDSNKALNGPDANVLFLPYDLAKIFLERFLATLYHLVPFWPKEAFYQQLDQLYRLTPDSRSDKWARSLLLLGLATGSLGTQHHSWGDILYERVKASISSLDDVVNLQTVQLSLFMAHFQNEQGRPNSAFLLMGAAARKAISAGLHKEAPAESNDAADSVEERRCTFWSLYFYEVWTCFHLGRPRSLSAKDIGIALPKDPFLQVLVHLSKIFSRSADEMYGRRHESLLQMWKIAKSISDDMRCYDSKMQHALGFGLDKPVQQGSLGVRQTILITLYYHTILLTFRPFLIFRGRWQHDMKMSSQRPGHSTAKGPTEIPTWLNEACNQALSAACRTIHHLYEASIYNELVRELRYHGYFLGSSSFALIYDLMHGENLASTHLPWIHAALQGLSSMRYGEPISSSMSAIQTVLRKLNPSYEWSPDTMLKGDSYNIDQNASAVRRYPSNVSHQPQGPIPDPLQSDLAAGGLSMLSDFQGNSLQDGLRMPSGSLGSGEDLLDFTQSDMGWDFDFSTMDLEAFFSINPTLDPPLF